MATTESPAYASRVKLETVTKAVEALLKWKDTKSKTENPQLIPQDDFVYLVLTLKMIPPKGRTNAYKIPLPTPLHAADSELCLIIDDRSKSNLTKEVAQKKIKSDDISISKLLRLSKLKSNYRPFEAKRKLCDSYDLFLADKRVMPMLPKLLGKHFYAKKKVPVAVNLNRKNWKEQIERVCGSALLYLKTGTCSVLKVARGSMEKDEIVANVAAAIEGACETVPKKWSNIRSLHLKFSESLSLPVYQALPDIKLKIEVASDEKEIKNEVSDKENMGESDGKKEEKMGKKESKKGRIREVRYMDTKVDDAMVEDDELGSNIDEDMKVTENDEMATVELKTKKRKKVVSKEKKVLSESKEKKKVDSKKTKLPIESKGKKESTKLENLVEKDRKIKKKPIEKAKSDKMKVSTMRKKVAAAK